MSPDACKRNPELSALPAGALYVHVPFCVAKCRYCDFYSTAREPGMGRAYVRSAKEELAMYADRLSRPLATVFVGGGTPTALGDELLDDLLNMLTPLTSPASEFSVEANPGTVDGPIADVLIRHGVNRVNLGVQSFNGAELAFLGRIHDAAQARGAVDILQKTGVENLGLDLIYGIPGQTMETWKASLEQALGLGIGHLSCYALSFEPGTPLWRDFQDGKVAAMDELLQKDCYYAAIAAAKAHGLEHYEISNFAKPSRRCRHNLTYWHNEPYLGIGPAAASYIEGTRRSNTPDFRAYIDRLGQNQPPDSQCEHLTGRPLMAETIMLTLRLIEGLDRAWFAGRFGQDVLEVFPKSINRYLSLGALIIDPSRLRLAPSYLFVCDSILADILAEAD